MRHFPRTKEFYIYLVYILKLLLVCENISKRVHCRSFLSKTMFIIRIIKIFWESQEIK